MSASELKRARARAEAVRLEKALRKMAMDESKDVIDRIRHSLYDNYPELLRGARI